MRKLDNEYSLVITHENVSVQLADQALQNSLSKLKNQNSPYLRQWYVSVPPSTDPDRKNYAVSYRDHLIGEVSLRNFTPLTCEIAYWTDESYWGLGLTTTAVSLVTDYAVNHLNVLEVLGYVHVENTPSIKVLEKVGFEKVDTTHKEMYYTSEKAPHYVYSYARI